MKKIEITVRHHCYGAMLNIHLDADSKQRFLEALQAGQFEASDFQVHLELSILPEWQTAGNLNHARIPIKTINLSATNEE